MASHVTQSKIQTSYSGLQGSLRCHLPNPLSSSALTCHSGAPYSSALAGLTPATPWTMPGSLVTQLYTHFSFCLEGSPPSTLMTLSFMSLLIWYLPREASPSHIIWKSPVLLTPFSALFFFPKHIAPAKLPDVLCSCFDNYLPPQEYPLCGDRDLGQLCSPLCAKA